MLLLAHAAFPGRIAVATVDHGLRPQSAAEAEMVGRLCAARGIAHATLHPDPALVRTPGQNLSATARIARYALLEGWRADSGLGWIATAHHADDQLETLLMRLARGSGVGGLAGVRSINGPIIRPLLGFRRDALHAICADAGVTVVDDPSNRDPAYDRARLRSALAQWQDGFALDPLAAARSAAALAEAEEALQWMASRLPMDGAIHDLPKELQRRMLLRLIREGFPDAPAPRGEAVDQALTMLAANKRVTLGNLLLSADRNGWHITPAPPRKH